MEHPRYAGALDCVKDDLDNADQFFSNLKMVGLLGCVAASFGPQAVVLAQYVLELALLMRFTRIMNQKESPILEQIV